MFHSTSYEHQPFARTLDGMRVSAQAFIIPAGSSLMQLQHGTIQREWWALWPSPRTSYEHRPCARTSDSMRVLAQTFIIPAGITWIHFHPGTFQREWWTLWPSPRTTCTIMSESARTATSGWHVLALFQGKRYVLPSYRLITYHAYATADVSKPYHNTSLRWGGIRVFICLPGQHKPVPAGAKAWAFRPTVCPCPVLHYPRWKSLDANSATRGFQRGYVEGLGAVACGTITM
jgi:hypothetical protein